MQDSLPSEPAPRFQVLSLAGGGYRGLYTAQVIADLEERLGAPIATRFDLIAGTSVGGILALALALEIPASRIVELFTKHGQDIFSKRLNIFRVFRSRYSAAKLRGLLAAEDLFGERLLGACKHPVLIPAINYSTGRLELFKTSHRADLSRDCRMPLVDAALATSAAPTYFPRHIYNNSQYVDGGLVVNDPATLALHEATKYLGQTDDAVHVMAVGTMSSRITVDPRRDPTGGLRDWGNGWPHQAAPMIFALASSVQGSMSSDMLRHRLGSRYLHIDDQASSQQARVIALDKTDRAAQEVLLSTARQRTKQCAGDPRVQGFLGHIANVPTFFNAASAPG
jgi:predicted acylesterase/phospholipase RssA